MTTSQTEAVGQVGVAAVAQQLSASAFLRRSSGSTPTSAPCLSTTTLQSQWIWQGQGQGQGQQGRGQGRGREPFSNKGEAGGCACCCLRYRHHST